MKMGCLKTLEYLVKSVKKCSLNLSVRIESSKTANWGKKFQKGQNIYFLLFKSFLVMRIMGKSRFWEKVEVSLGKWV